MNAQPGVFSELSPLFECTALRILSFNLSSFNPYHAKLIYSNFYSLEVVSRYRDPQLQVTEIYSYLENLKMLMFKYTFYSQSQ